MHQRNPTTSVQQDTFGQALKHTGVKGNVSQCPALETISINFNIAAFPKLSIPTYPLQHPDTVDAHPLPHTHTTQRSQQRPFIANKGI